jgi:Rrf2 family protein
LKRGIGEVYRVGPVVPAGAPDSIALPRPRIRGTNAISGLVEPERDAAIGAAERFAADIVSAEHDPDGPVAIPGPGKPGPGIGAKQGSAHRSAIHRILRSMRLELTKRGDYAVRAMLALARGSGGGAPVSGNGLLSSRRIATAMAIPVRFLPQVLADLQRAGLVEAAPGRSGGYRLAKEPASISLLDVIEAVEGESRRKTCVLRGGPCGVDGSCDVHEVFFAGQEALLSTLGRATLADLAAPATAAALGQPDTGIAAG